MLDDFDWAFNPSIRRKQVLAGEDAAAADLAKLRLFAGLSIEEAASALGASRATPFRNWVYERTQLQTELSRQERSKKI